mmetsp:Transcript_65398/g.206636  ORF Transcript_65398/g.206636 Transcript_65398/m.206636 type:complete len:359 (-) Transcript_65398:182-1258(-)
MVHHGHAQRGLLLAVQLDHGAVVGVDGPLLLHHIPGGQLAVGLHLRQMHDGQRGAVDPHGGHHRGELQVRQPPPPAPHDGQGACGPAGLPLQVPWAAPGLVDALSRHSVGRGPLRSGGGRWSGHHGELHVHLQPREHRQGVQRERPGVGLRADRGVLRAHGLDWLRCVRPRKVAVFAPGAPAATSAPGELPHHADRPAWPLQLVLDAPEVRALRGDLPGEAVQERRLLLAPVLAHVLQGSPHGRRAPELLLVAQRVLGDRGRGGGRARRDQQLSRIQGRQRLERLRRPGDRAALTGGGRRARPLRRPGFCKPPGRPQARAERCACVHVRVRVRLCVRACVNACTRGLRGIAAGLLPPA